MKIFVTVSQASQEAVEALVAIYPEGASFGRTSRGGQRLSGWHAELPRGDDRIVRAQEVLSEAGLMPQKYHFAAPDAHEYRFGIRRKYGHRDLEACEHLQFCGTSAIYGLSRDAEGRIKLTRSQLKRRKQDRVLYACVPGWHVVSTQTREIIESFSLAHVVFRPTVLVNRIGSDQRYYSWDSFGDPWWEISSDLVLPPMAPSMDIYDKDHHPVRGNYSNGCYIREGIYSPVEFHYMREAIASVEPFDLACTHERVGLEPADDNRHIIASKRFYLICREHGIKAYWVPVRIDGE